MRKIKFRGVDLKTGEFVYGDFVHKVPMSSFNGIVDEFGVVHEIEPDSQKQLVGFDNQGREVYQGDVFYYSPEGRPISAELVVVLADNNGHSYYFDKNLLSDVPFPYS